MYLLHKKKYLVEGMCVSVCVIVYGGDEVIFLTVKKVKQYFNLQPKFGKIALVN